MVGQSAGAGAGPRSCVRTRADGRAGAGATARPWPQPFGAAAGTSAGLAVPAALQESAGADPVGGQWRVGAVGRCRQLRHHRLHRADERNAGLCAGAPCQPCGRSTQAVGHGARHRVARRRRLCMPRHRAGAGRCGAALGGRSGARRWPGVGGPRFLCQPGLADGGTLSGREAPGHTRCGARCAGRHACGLHGHLGHQWQRPRVVDQDRCRHRDGRHCRQRVAACPGPFL